MIYNRPIRIPLFSLWGDYPCNPISAFAQVIAPIRCRQSRRLGDCAAAENVEFKSTFNQDVIVSLVVFANADGGNVYVGVRDYGKVVGVQLAAESETTWINEIKSKTAPAIVPEADRIVVNGKTVVRLHISPLPVKPTSVQGRYYVRKAKSNHLMSVAELSDMYLKATSSSWDAFPSEHSLEDISLEKVAAFAKRMNPNNTDDPMRLLRKLSLVKDGKPTNACYLAFVEDYGRLQGAWRRYGKF